MAKTSPNSASPPAANRKSSHLRLVGDASIEQMQTFSRRPLFIGLVIVSVFVGIVLVWAGTARLSSAALAPGVVSVEGERKTIQHLEGGIVRKINVRDGQQVSAGETLIELDGTKPRADVKILTNRWIHAQARQARLRAERDEADAIAYPPAFKSIADDQGEIAAAMEEQALLFSGRKRRHEEKIRRHRERIVQLEKQIGARQSEYAVRDRQLKLVRAEIRNLSGLRQQGLLARDKVYELEQREAEIEAEKNAAGADIASSRENISVVGLRVSEINDERSDQADVALQSLQLELVEINERLRTATDTLKRTLIGAPQGGTVINLQVHTIGGVIKSGEPLLDIVPVDAKLVIDTKVETKDRDVVREGLPAEIRFTAFSRRSTLPVKGEVIFISADRLTEATTGMPYYSARVAFKEDPSQVLNGAVIHAGMQAEVLIVTGDRTALEYLFQPITRSIGRALKED